MKPDSIKTEAIIMLNRTQDKVFDMFEYDELDFPPNLSEIEEQENGTMYDDKPVKT